MPPENFRIFVILLAILDEKLSGTTWEKLSSWRYLPVDIGKYANEALSSSMRAENPHIIPNMSLKIKTHAHSPR